MDTLLAQGDHATDARGLPCAISGERELIQRALIRLSVRRGSFPCDPELGSELHRLPGAHGNRLNALALSYVQEALAGMAGASVRGVEVTRQDGGTLHVAVQLCLRGQVYPLEVEVQ